MKLIVGLGNPGTNYIDSRHNIGFVVVKALAKAYRIDFKKDSGAFSLSCKAKAKDKDIILAMPFTFMNLSGSAVKVLLKKYKIELNDLLVVCDDVDLEFGRIKIRAKGTSGGQRGLKSIIGSLESQEFCRLRVGIGRPHGSSGTAEYVLSRFNKEEKRQLKDIVEKASDCCEAWVGKGITESMNIFNTRSKNNE